MTNKPLTPNKFSEAITCKVNIISELPARIQKKIRVELVSKQNVEGPCWTWTACSYEGYGRLKVKPFNSGKAHRVIYQLLRGPVSDDLVCDHLCKNTYCVNPSHIEIVTQTENLKRSNCASTINASRTHCVAGHEFTIANTYIWRTKRFCLACNTRRNAAYHSRKRIARRGQLDA